METISINNEIAYQLKWNPNYYITKSGKLYSIYIKGAHGKTDINNPHSVAYGQDRDGYYRVVLSNQGCHQRIKIHQIMIKQFIGDIPDGMVVNHKDGNKHNNNLDNLEIITNLENIQHAWENGLVNKEKNPNRVHVDVYDNLNNTFTQYTSLYDLRQSTKLYHGYIDRIRKNKIVFGDCQFVKRVIGKKQTDYYIECYHNGTLFKIFDNVKEAGAYFGKPGNSVSSSYRTQYPKTVNRYTLTFPNVSTIENTVNNRK